MTITHNIHYNLAAWASGTFVLGQRCSSGGNAYRCTSPGSSTFAPSGTGSSISGGRALFKWLSAVDYTSLANWSAAVVAAYNATGLPDDLVAQVWATAVITVSIAPTSLLSLYSTSNNGHSVLITAAPGDSFRDKGANTALAWTAANGVAFDIATGTEIGDQFVYIDALMQNVTIRGLQFRDTNAPGANPETMINLQGNGSVVQDCILDGYAQLYTGGNNIGLVNCLIFNRYTVTHLFPIKWDTTCTGAFLVNCTVIATSGGGPVIGGLNSTPATAIARNCAFFGTTNAVVSQNVTGQWVIDHCAFSGTVAQNITSPANGFPNTDGGGNRFSQASASQFVSTTTDLRLKAGAGCIDTGIPDLSHLAAADDTYGTPRPRGSQWDIGAYEYGAHNVLLGRAQTQVAHETGAAGTGGRNIGKSLGLVNGGPFSSDFSQDFGPRGLMASIATTKITAGTSKAVGAAIGSATSFVRVFGKFTASIQTQSSVQNIERAAVNVSAAHMPQQASMRRFMGVSIRAASLRMVVAYRSISTDIVGATSGQSSSLINSVGKLASVTSTQAFAMVRLVGKLVSVTGSQTIAYVRAISTSLSVASSEVANIIIAGKVLAHQLVSVTFPQAISVQARLSAFRSFGSSISETVTTFQGQFHSQSFSVASGYTAEILRQTTALRSVISQQVVSLQKTAGSNFAISGAQTTTLLKAVGKPLAVLSAATVALVHVQQRLFGTVSSASAAALKNISTTLAGAVNPQVAAQNLPRILSRILTATSASAINVLRSVSSGFGATSGASQATAKGVGVSLALGQAETASILSGAAIGSTAHAQISAASDETVTVLRTPSKLLLAVDAQVAAQIANRGTVLLTVSSKSTGIQRQISIIRATSGASPGALVVAVFKEQFQSFGVASANLAASMASRVVSVGAVQAAVQAIVSWYRFYIPPAVGPAVLIPPADGPPEPFAFGAMDPADTQTFIFDWSRRSTVGDIIQSVTVTSIPPGMNFISPVFVQGMFVEVTCGPFSPPQVPAVYGLRCSVRFVSGRRSSYTVPIPIMRL